MGCRSVSIEAAKHATREKARVEMVYLGVSHSSWLHVEKYKVQVSAIWTRLKHAWNDSAVNQSLPNHTPIDLLKKGILASGGFTWPSFNDWVLRLDLAHSVMRATYDGIHQESCRDSTRYVTEKLWVSSVAKDNAAHRSSTFALRAKPTNGLQGLWRGTIRTKSHKEECLNDFLCHLIQICILLIFLYKKTLFLASI